jgi:hypothetical protein
MSDTTKWIDEAMNSLDGMRPAQPPRSLFDHIERRIQNGVAVAKTIPLYKVSLAAASILLLLALNIFVASKTKHATQGQQDEVQSLAEYYGFTDKGMFGL